MVSLLDFICVPNNSSNLEKSLNLLSIDSLGSFPPLGYACGEEDEFTLIGLGLGYNQKPRYWGWVIHGKPQGLKTRERLSKGKDARKAKPTNAHY